MNKQNVHMHRVQDPVDNVGPMVRGTVANSCHPHVLRRYTNHGSGFLGRGQFVDRQQVLGEFVAILLHFLLSDAVLGATVVTVVNPTDPH